jgi:hypothetical protein
LSWGLFNKVNKIVFPTWTDNENWYTDRPAISGGSVGRKIIKEQRMVE